MIPPGWAPAPGALAAAGLAALAVLLAWPPRGDRRLTSAARRRLPSWLAGPAGAAPLSRRLLHGAGVGLAMAVLLLRVGPAAALLAGAAGTVAAAVILGWLEPSSAVATRRRRIDDTPQALGLLASCLMAGLPVRAALSAVVEVLDGPLADDLYQLRRLTDLGHDDVSAWRTLAKHEQLGPAALDLARSIDTGSLLVEALLVHAEVARADRRGEVEAAARRVGVRSVLPLMVCFIPAFLLLGVVPTVASAVMSALHF